MYGITDFLEFFHRLVIWKTGEALHSLGIVRDRKSQSLDPTPSNRTNWTCALPLFHLRMEADYFAKSYVSFRIPDGGQVHKFCK
jgi:hypothetical protein